MVDVHLEVPPFSPSQPGPGEEEWELALAHVPPIEIPRGRIVVVAPHPDDETLGAGGVIATAVAAGSPVRIVSCTDGEAAYPVPGLGPVRRLELDAAVDRLVGSVDGDRRSVSCVFLGLPDGALLEAESTLEARLAEVIASADLVVAPWSGDGHPDHEVVGRVCRRLCAERGQPLLSYPIWAWHWAEPATLVDDSMVRLELSDEARRAKASGLRAFATQTSGTHGAPMLPSHVLEHFRRTHEVFFHQPPRRRAHG
jgi:LmbE family N-acetylglucosaminyl deacetylase